MKNTINLKDFKCYWCKGMHLEKISEEHYKCKSCGYVNYKLSNKDNIRFENAQSYMTNFEYEKADRIYQELYNCDERLTKIQALIGRIFAYFGVAYIKDFNNELVPIFSKYDPKYKSIKSIKYYEEIELLDREKRFIEMIDKADEEYKKIEKLLNETPEYDAFICCKNSKKTIQNPNEEGPTEDRNYAIDLHNYLNKNNKKVFYSEEDLVGIETDGQIYSAIMKSKTMILIISNNDYFYSPWVRSEWERWINLIKKGIRKENTLIVYECPSKDLKNSVLFPESFNKPQIKKDKLDVIKALNNVLKTDNTIDNLLKEAKYNLDMFKIDEAEKIYKQITHDYPEDYRGWLGLVDILIEKEVSENDKRYQRWLDFAIEFADDANKKIIRKKYCKEEYKKEKEFEDAEDKYEKELYDDAFKIFEKLATEYNYEKAYNKMGECLYYGKGVPRDYKKALYWYEKAANSGDADAQYNLGNMYYNGDGTPQDYEKAFYWYEKAANSGEFIAQYKLGKMYYYGEGVVQDYEKAFYWYEKAANAGDSDAQINLGYMYEKGEGVVQDYKKALYWYEKAANAGDTSAQFYLGGRYYYEVGIPQDYKKAFYWYEKAANAGNIIAQEMLGLMYYYGKGVHRDYKKSLYWYEKAANAGSAFVQYILGNRYYNGDGTPQDYKKAFYWYEKAANSGDSDAQYNLSQMYKYGYGVEKNIELAEYWERKSKENK